MASRSRRGNTKEEELVELSEEGSDEEEFEEEDGSE